MVLAARLKGANPGAVAGRQGRLGTRADTQTRLPPSAVDSAALGSRLFPAWLDSSHRPTSRAVNLNW